MLLPWPLPERVSNRRIDGTNEHQDCFKAMILHHTCFCVPASTTRCAQQTTDSRAVESALSANNKILQINMHKSAPSNAAYAAYQKYKNTPIMQAWSHNNQNEFIWPNRKVQNQLRNPLCTEGDARMSSLTF